MCGRMCERKAYCFGTYASLHWVWWIQVRFCLFCVCLCMHNHGIVWSLRLDVSSPSTDSAFVYTHIYMQTHTNTHTFSHPVWTHVLLCSCMILMLYPWFAYKSQQRTCLTYKILFIGVKMLFMPSIWAWWHSAGLGQYKRVGRGGC